MRILTHKPDSSMALNYLPINYHPRVPSKMRNKLALILIIAQLAIPITTLANPARRIAAIAAQMERADCSGEAIKEAPQVALSLGVVEQATAVVFYAGEFKRTETVAQQLGNALVAGANTFLVACDGINSEELWEIADYLRSDVGQPPDAEVRPGRRMIQSWSLRKIYNGRRVKVFSVGATRGR